jgi:hypothetical protein
LIYILFDGKKSLRKVNSMLSMLNKFQVIPRSLTVRTTPKVAGTTPEIRANQPL